MKLKLIASLVAASFLAGCSSSGSSDNNGPTPQDGIADVQYFEGENTQAALIKGDEGTYQAAMIKGKETDTLIRINGQTFTTDGDSVKDVNGVTVGHIQKEGDSIIFHGNHGAEVNLSVVNGRLIVTDVQHPIDPNYGIIPTPDHPIERPAPEHPIEIDPDYDAGVAPTYGDILAVGGAVIVQGDNDNQAIVRMDDQGNAIVFINDYDNGFVISNSEIHDTDGNLVGHASKEGDNYIVRLEDGTEVVFRNDNGRLFAAVVARPDIDNPIEIAPEADNGRSVDKIADNAWVVTTHGEIDGYITIENGTVYLRDSDRNEITNWKPIDPGFGALPTPENPIERPSPQNPIQLDPEADNGRSVDKIAGNAWAITTHGEVDGYITIENGTVYLRDSDRNEVKNWKPIDPSFGVTPTPESPIERPSPQNPIELDPEADNGRSVDKIADNAWVITTHDEIDGYITIENGTVYLRDSDRNEITNWKPIDPNFGIKPTPEKPIEIEIEADNGRSVDKIADNAWAITTHDEVDGYITIESGTIYLRDSDRNEIKSWKPQLPKDLNDIKKKARSLSQEQRQQIKQAIKDRAARS